METLWHKQVCFVPVLVYAGTQFSWGSFVIWVAVTIPECMLACCTVKYHALFHIYSVTIWWLRPSELVPQVFCHKRKNIKIKCSGGVPTKLNFILQESESFAVPVHTFHFMDCDGKLL